MGTSAAPRTDRRHALAAARAGADGPANLVAAVLTAASRLSRERGVLVAMNDTIHAARWITKSHALSVQTFVSSDSGPLGYVYEETPVYINTLSRLPKIDRTQFNADVKIGFTNRCWMVTRRCCEACLRAADMMESSSPVLEQDMCRATKPTLSSAMRPAFRSS